MDNARDLPRLTLTRSLYGYVLVTMLLIVIAGGSFLTSRANPMIDEALDRAVKIRTATAAMDLARSLDEDWRGLQVMAERAATEPPAGQRALFDGMRGDGARLSWIGFVDIDGRVLGASEGLLLGRDVSQRPWFRNGLIGAYAGDVHESPLLQPILGEPEGSPLRFIDLSRPVTAPDGSVIGMIAVLISFDWVSARMRETAASLGIDLYLIAQDGSVILSTTGDHPTPAELGILRAAQTGTQTALRGSGPTGRNISRPWCRK